MTTTLLLLANIPASTQHTLMQSFNINDGLVSNQVRGFYQDKKGFLWIMTWEGLSRHDGHSFRNYTLADGLAHPMSNAMLEDDDGKIYIAENDGSVDVMVNGEVKKELRKKNEKAINELIREPSGRILAPSDGRGVCVFDKGIATTLKKSDTSITVFDIIPLSGLFIICGTTSGVMLHDHTFLKLWPDNVEYNSILKDNLGRIWVGTSKGLKWVNLSSGQSQQYELDPTSFENTPWANWIVRDIIQTSDKSIWIAATGGLIQIRPDQSWRLYSRNDGLPTDYLTSVFEDKSGFLWIGTDQGVAKLDIKTTIDIFTTSEDLPSNIVTDILPTGNGDAFIISDATSIFRIKLNQTIHPVDLDNPGNIYEFLIMGNDTLVSTDKGRYKISNNQASLWTSLPFSVAVLSLKMNDDCIFSSATNKITATCPDGSHTDSTLSDLVFAMSHGFEDELWIGTHNNGLFKVQVLANASGKMEMELEDMSGLVPEKTIRSVHGDQRGNVWIGTRYSGLLQLYIDSLTGKYATHIFDRSDGFISNFIKSIDSDKDGNIWVGTHAGIEKLVPTPNGYRVFSFSRVHNFFAIIIKLVVGPDKSIWCITTSGVVRVKDSRYETTPPSEVYITSVSTTKKVLLDPGYQLPFALNYNENFMDVEFSSNDHINGKQIKYSYRLQGSQDTSWSNPLPIHKVSFANLLPGNYSFEVRALGWNETLGEKTFYNFRIRPPYWRQTWFVGLSFVALLVLLYAFYRYRIRQLKRIQEVRDRIASDLHDEIGSSLTHVNILSEIGKKTSDPDEQPQKLFNRIGEEVQSSSEALDDIIWSVSSRADTAEDLISRMRRYASELFDAKGISFLLQVDHLDESQAIGLELRRDVYLIYKELLRNIIRHAEATEVDVKIKGENQLLWLIISDNGKGFDANAHTERHGLYSIKGRVTKWKGHIVIESLAGKGTLIRIGLPLKSSRFLRKR